MLSPRAHLSVTHWLFGVALLGALACAASGCGDGGSGPSPSAAPSAGAVGPVGPDGKPREPFKAPERSGGALRRSADGARLYLADEDHRVVRIVSLPFGEKAAPAGWSPSSLCRAPPPSRSRFGS